MTKILIAYGTTEGHTARIAEYLADDIRGRGHVADVVDLNGGTMAYWMITTR
jgi:menaquinone-dependent protoporphyrinogen oxidase